MVDERLILQSSLHSCFRRMAKASPARNTYFCILMCVQMSITGIIKRNFGSDCLRPQGRDSNICCNNYLFLIFLNKDFELFMFHCSNTHTLHTNTYMLHTKKTVIREKDLTPT